MKENADMFAVFERLAESHRIRTLATILAERATIRYNNIVRKKCHEEICGGNKCSPSC